MIEIKLFKFDSKTDYLPYYKSYKLERESVNTVNDVLNAVNAIEKFGFLGDELFFLQANNIYTDSGATLDEVMRDSNELVLEPLSINRAVNDLIIDTKDYQEKLDFLDAYFNAEEKALIVQEKRYMLEYYASNTLHFNNDYIGEHVLFLASELIQNNPTLKNELSALVDTEDGIRIRSSLEHRVLNMNEQNTPVYNKVTLDSEILQYFDNFNIALYCALNNTSFENIIKQSNATYVELKSKHFDIPKNADKLSMLMAGSVLLEALDNDADFLIINNDEELALFDAKQKSIEKTMGREINLPIITQNEFVRLLQGQKNLSSRKIKIPFLT